MCEQESLFKTEEQVKGFKRQTYFELIKPIQRAGFKQFCDWLHVNTDFLNAPASTRFHGAEKGGLLNHSLRVYYNLLRLAKGDYNIDTIKIVALYHDICKANFYEESQKNVKDKKTGQWKSVPYYTVNEQYPYGGHGAKSVYLLMAHGVPLTEEEAAAINCHMGGWDYTTYHNPSNAFEKYPLAVYLHIADMLASYIDKS